MRSIFVSSLLIALALAGGLTVIPAQDAKKAAHAQEVLKQARVALGGEANLKAIRSLSASGKFSGAMGGRTIEGKLNLDLLLPDKYMRTIKMSMGPMNITRIEAVNGDEVWMDLKRGGGIGGILGGIGGMGGRGGMGGHGGGGRGGDGPMGEMQVMNSPEMQAQVRADFTRLLVAWLLISPVSSQVEFSYEQELETKEGKADALRVAGADEFTMLLGVGQQTHRPVMLAYRALMPRHPTGSRSDQEPSDRPREPELVDMQVYLSDYKSVGKVFLPHRIVKTSNGQTVEEWVISKYKLNPNIKPNKFEKKS